MDEALTVAAPAPPEAGLPAALGGRRRRVGRRDRPPAPDPARRRRRDRGVPRPALRAHPLPALLRPVPAHLRRATWSGSPSSTTTPAWRSSACSATRSSPSAATRARTARTAPDRRPGRGRVRRRATTTRAAGSARSCSSTSPRPAGSAGMRRFEAEVLRREPPDGAGVPRRRLPGQPRVRRRRAAPRVRHRPHRALDGGPRRPRAARRGPQRAQRAAPALGRGHRRLHRPDQDRPRGAAATCCAATSPAPSTRSTRRPGRCAGCAPTRRSPTSRTTVDLAVVAVPAAGIGEVMGSCLAKGVHGAGRASAPGSPTPGRTA